MQFDDPIWLEVVRLTHKFFPESRAYIQKPFDLGLDSACEILRSVNPDLTRVLYDPDLEDSELYNWIMETTAFSPSGRAVVVPECQHAERVPFVCDFKRVAERIDEGVPAALAHDWWTPGSFPRMSSGDLLCQRNRTNPAGPSPWNLSKVPWTLS